MRSPCQPAAVLLAAAILSGCGRGATEGTGTVASPAAQTVRLAQVQHLQPHEARQLLQDQPGALVLDVRGREETSDAIQGSRNVPFGELESRVEELSGWRERPVIVVDRAGESARRAATLLVSKGFRNVYQLEGGMVSWQGTETSEN